MKPSRGENPIEQGHDPELGAESRSPRGNSADSPAGMVLTRTEMKVLRPILDGKSNKETAYLLHRSVRTIEDHRSHIMHKLGVDNLVDLVKRAAAMGLVELPTTDNAKEL